MDMPRIGAKMGERRRSRWSCRVMMALMLPCASWFWEGDLLAQPTEIIVETYAENIGMVDTTDLTGYNTYRVYVKFTNEQDFLAAVYGDTDYPTRIRGGNNFYQNVFGNMTNEAYNSFLFGTFPDVEYDSFVTIGMTAPASIAAGEAPINAVADPMNNWITEFDPLNGAPGSDIIIDSQTGGSWFPLFPDANAFAGEDLQVLIGQFTTDTVLHGVISIATFIDGQQPNDTLVTFPFSSNPDTQFGCTDMDALNYDPTANEDDDSCEYSCDYLGTQLVVSAISTEPVSCYGYSDGSCMVTVTGGQGSLTYSNGVTTNATGLFYNLNANDWTITVTDNVGCSVQAVAMIGSPDPLIVTAQLVAPISCYGEADAVIGGTSIGGVGASTYSLTAPADTGTGPYFSNGVEEALFSDINVGLYTVYAIDENGCVDNTPGISVSQPQPFNVFIQDLEDVQCSDGGFGFALANFFGGSGNGTVYSLDGENYQESGYFEVPVGAYTLYAADVNGCPDTLQFEIQSLSQPIEVQLEALVASGSSTSEGAIDVSVSGGTPPYVFYWSSFGIAQGFSEDLEGVPPGIYSLDVYDAYGCTYTNTWEVGANDISGCTDGLALNYDPSAALNDGSCSYPPCDDWVTEPDVGLVVSPDSILAVTGSMVDREMVLEVGYSAEDPSTGLLFDILFFSMEQVTGLPSGFELEWEVSEVLPGNPECIRLMGAPEAIGIWSIEIQGSLYASIFGTPLDVGDYSTGFTLVVEQAPGDVTGCTYDNAFNYQFWANVDDGSCVYAGCTNELALNYSALFSVDDGSCLYAEDFEGFGENFICRADFDESGFVGVSDLLIFLSAMESACE